MAGNPPVSVSLRRLRFPLGASRGWSAAGVVVPPLAAETHPPPSGAPCRCGGGCRPSAVTLRVGNAPLLWSSRRFPLDLRFSRVFQGRFPFSARGPGSSCPFDSRELRARRCCFCHFCHCFPCFPLEPPRRCIRGPGFLLPECVRARARAFQTHRSLKHSSIPCDDLYKRAADSRPALSDASASLSDFSLFHRFPQLHLPMC